MKEYQICLEIKKTQLQETFVQINKKFKEALHSFRSYSKNWKLTKLKITLCFDFGDKSCNEFCCNCYFCTSCTGNYKQFAYSVPSICNKFCKNMGHFLLNIDRCLMSSASVVFIIKCMRSKNVCSTASVFFSLCYQRQKHFACGLIKSSSMWHFPQKLSR